MAEIPTTEWNVDTQVGQICLGKAPFNEPWMVLDAKVQHVFTHFHLELTLYANCSDKKHSDYTLSEKTLYWVKKEELNQHPIPSVMNKVIKAASRACCEEV